MPDSRARLIRCFAAVFPKTATNEIPTMAQAGMEEWDSLATATLFMLVQEEFEIEFDLAELERLDSFPRIEEYLILHNSCSSRSIGD